ncbi:MAG: hypothetical protein PHT07_22845 [Paludibacter sp.]|nr:hypothetical protein [Paludibacter sp.]
MIKKPMPSPKSQNQQQCHSFLLRHPDYFLDAAAQYYPFTKAQLIRYHDRLKWYLISENQNICWSYDLLQETKDLINWEILSNNPSAFKDLSLLDSFSDLINWEGLDEGCGDSISSNKGLLWDMDFIQKHETKINFKKLSHNTSVQWSENLIDKYLNCWDLVELGSNDSVPWTLKLFDKYLDETDLRNWRINTNSKIISNFDLVEKYKNLLYWDTISSNPYLPWAEKNLLHYWSDRIKWLGIARNEFLFKNDKTFFIKHLDKWYANNYNLFGSLSSNPALPWDKFFIDYYKPYWNWEDLSLNEGIPWNIELIDIIVDDLPWGVFRDYCLEDEYGKIIAPTGGFILDPGLVLNESVPWSVEMLEHFENKLDFRVLRLNKAVWKKAFNRLVDERMVEDLMDLV